MKLPSEFEASGICRFPSRCPSGGSAWVCICLLYYKVFSYCREKGRSSLGLDVPKALTVDTRGTSISLGDTVGLFEGLHLRNVHEEGWPPSV
jgi:hypothetical protein